MQNTAPIKTAIAELTEKITPLLQRLQERRNELAEAESENWIEANGVTLADVQPVDVDGEYFGMLHDFSVWLRKQPHPKRFCEWNDMILLTAEVINGTGSLSSPGRMSTLKRLEGK